VGLLLRFQSVTFCSSRNLLRELGRLLRKFSLLLKDRLGFAFDLSYAAPRLQKSQKLAERPFDLRLVLAHLGEGAQFLGGIRAGVGLVLLARFGQAWLNLTQFLTSQALKFGRDRLHPILCSRLRQFVVLQHLQDAANLSTESFLCAAHAGLNLLLELLG